MDNLLNQTFQLPCDMSLLLDTLLIDDHYLSDNYSKSLSQEFVSNLEHIVRESSNYRWTTFSFLHQVKDQVFSPVEVFTWPELLGFFVSLILLLVLESKFKISRWIFRILKPILRFIPKIFLTIFHRAFAVFVYIYPLLGVYAMYMPILIPYYRDFDFLVPGFIEKGVTFYLAHPKLLYWYYAVCYSSLGSRFPRARVVRFHAARSLMITVFQTFLANHYLSLERSFILGCETKETLVSFATLYVFINFWWLLPSLIQAVTLTYPKSKFIREAVEVHVGRDDFDPDFEWWDRKKKKKKK